MGNEVPFKIPRVLPGFALYKEANEM